MVRRGLVPTAEEATLAVERGDVTVGGAPATTGSRLVGPGESIALAQPAPRFVGRGGEKLSAALERFGVDLTGAYVVDAGASTGGFTDCALQAGAARVVAVDVGRGQLHERLRQDPRVDTRERTNIRHLTIEDLDGPADALVADLSFISLRTVAPALVWLCRDGADLILLVKPQFEAAHQEASLHRGVITDPEVWHRVLGEVTSALVAHGAAIMDVMTSPLRGADGNVEFLVHARTATPAASSDATARLLHAAVHQVSRPT